MNNAAEFDHDGNLYRIERLNVIVQANLLRRLSPLLPALLPAVGAAMAKGKKLADKLDELSPLLRPLTDQLAALPDEVLDYVIRTCMGAIRRKAADQWVAIWVDSASRSQFDLNDLMTTFIFCRKVIEVTLGPFFSGLLTAAGIAAQQEEPTAS